MKKVISFCFLAASLMSFTKLQAQDTEDKSKRPSPPAMVSQKIKSGATITIDYSQPSMKGRTIGQDVEPMDGQVWRTGANEATVFETDQDLKIEGETLPAGKYALFTIFDKGDATVIFNKTWKQWGAFKYDESEDALRIKADVDKEKTSTEKMTFTISPGGEVALLWGDRELEFEVE